MYKVVDRAIGFVEVLNEDGLIAFTSYFYDENEHNIEGTTPRPSTVKECKEFLETIGMWVIVQ